MGPPYGKRDPYHGTHIFRDYWGSLKIPLIYNSHPSKKKTGGVGIVESMFPRKFPSAP